jgi:hypothetical protein
MTVQSSTFEAVFGSDPLGRFTAAIITTVPEFDPGDTPIGHALAAEFFQRVQPDALHAKAREPQTVEPETTLLPVVLAPERVYEWTSGNEPVRRPSPRPRVEETPVAEEHDEAAADIAADLANDDTQDDDQEVSGTVLELPVGASSVEWFGVTTEPDEEIEQQARRAS